MVINFVELPLDLKINKIKNIVNRSSIVNFKLIIIIYYFNTYIFISMN